MTAEPEPGVLSSYPIQLSNFEGPLDLLLQLIEDQELDVTEIALNAVTEQYLAHMRAMEELDLEVAAEFIVVAARLLDLKARTLLPPERRDANQDSDEEDPAEELIHRLLAYQKFREVAEHLRQREGEEALRFPRTPEELEVLESEAELEGVTMADLIALVDEVVRAADARGTEAEIREIDRDGITVADRIRAVLWQLRRGRGAITFKSIFSGQATRLEVVVTFLAVLQLLGQRKVRAVQHDTMGPIYIESLERDAL